MSEVLARLLEEVGDARIAFCAPGRANLIGEHTDYNNGFVLPVALNLATYIAGKRVPERVILRSLNEPGEVVVELRNPELPSNGWGRYVAGVVLAMRDASVEIRGFEGAIASEVPIGSGLSSSAALEVSIALALGPSSLTPISLAEICQRAENRYVGVRSGIMDQLASSAGQRDKAMLIDCRSSEVTPVPIPPELSILVIDSGVNRGLSESGYNERRSQCEAAARSLGVSSLRDVSPDQLANARTTLDEVVFRRARHVVTENRRVLDTVKTLSASRFDDLGRLFAASHESLATDYQVSIPELDTLVACANQVSGVVAARLTGAGFGGCTVNLVYADATEEAAEAITACYEKRTGLRSRSWISPAADGGHALSL
jgi:galactokinase